MREIFQMGYGSLRAGHLSCRAAVHCLACVGLTVAGLTLLGCSGKAQRSGSSQADAPMVLVAPATTQTLPVEVRTIGNVEPMTSIAIRSQVSGELAQIFFEEGGFVQKGQTLFSIDERPYQTMVSQAEANLARDMAQLRQAKANLARDMAQEKFAREQAQRYSDLNEQGVLSKMQSDQTQSDADVRVEAVQADQAAIESAQAAIEADKAALDRSKLDLSYCTIRSPIDGRTGALKVKPGNLVASNSTEFATINQLQPIYVTFSVSEKYLPDIRKFMAEGKVPVLSSPRNDSSAPEKGLLAFVDNTVDLATGTIKLKASFANEDRKLWPGQFVDVKLQLSTQPDLVVVPAEAVQTGQDGAFVFVVKPNSTVEARPVTAGMQVDQQMVIEKGLRAGEMVVTEGQLRLIPGSRVRIQNSSDAQTKSGNGL